MLKSHLPNIDGNQKPWAATSCLVLIALGAVSMTGCSSFNGENAQATAATTSSQTGENSDAIRAAASDAAVQPLRDFGMVKRKIPPALARISDPYAPPEGQTCAWIQYEIQQLDAALQGDVEAPVAHDDRSMATKGGSIAKEGATEAVRGVGSMLVPQRSLVRMLTGASKSDRLYAEAQQRGMVRRGYLRGLADSKKC